MYRDIDIVIEHNKHYKIRCLECGKILESRYAQEYKECGCPNETMVDGGYDYCRYGAKNMNKITLIDIT